MKAPSLQFYGIYAVVGLIYAIPYSVLSMKHASVTAMTMLASALLGFSSGNTPFTVSVLVIATMVSMILLFKLGLISEGFSTQTPPKDIADRVRKMNNAAQSIEGYEDVKKEKNENPAPATKLDEMPSTFKLGEIPSQVKNGPHIDAGSTLMKAIHSLNPDQITAMTKDTQQLIETQKSLMGMLGTMKPMLNDGKQLMDTFQQMFGE